MTENNVDLINLTTFSNEMSFPPQGVVWLEPGESVTVTATRKIVCCKSGNIDFSQGLDNHERPLCRYSGEAGLLLCDYPGPTLTMAVTDTASGSTVFDGPVPRIYRKYLGGRHHSVTIFNLDTDQASTMYAHIF